MKKKAKKITMETLAGMVQRGFLSIGKEMAKQKDLVTVKNDMTVLKADVYALKEDTAILKKDVADLKEDFHKILDALDKVAKHYDNYLKEVTARDAEVKRMKRWIEQIAQKVGVELVD